jgi:hypothetical protein
MFAVEDWSSPPLKKASGFHVRPHESTYVAFPPTSINTSVNEERDGATKIAKHNTLVAVIPLNNPIVKSYVLEQILEDKKEEKKVLKSSQQCDSKEIKSEKIRARKKQRESEKCGGGIRKPSKNMRSQENHTRKQNTRLNLLSPFFCFFVVRVLRERAMISFLLQ